VERNPSSSSLVGVLVMICCLLLAFMLTISSMIEMSSVMLGIYS